MNLVPTGGHIANVYSATSTAAAAHDSMSGLVLPRGVEARACKQARKEREDCVSQKGERDVSRGGRRQGSRRNRTGEWVDGMAVCMWACRAGSGVVQTRRGGRMADTAINRTAEGEARERKRDEQRSKQ